MVLDPVKLLDLLQGLLQNYQLVFLMLCICLNLCHIHRERTDTTKSPVVGFSILGLLSFSVVLQDLVDVKALFGYLVEGAVLVLLAFFKIENLGGLAKELELVSHQDYTLVLESTKHTIVEDAFGHVCVNGTERVVQQDDICVRVDGSG